jgi:hypothetical protein
MVGVSDIGRRSFWTDLRGLTFGFGKTFAIFQIVGTWLSLTEALNIAQTGLQRDEAPSLSNQFGMTSGPGWSFMYFCPTEP